jgi:hypothetical protein
MGARDYFKRWFGTAPANDGPAAPGVTGQGQASQQSRRRAARVASDRSVLWTEEPETCEVCGRRLLTGELPALLQKDDQALLVCPVCAMHLAASGFRSPLSPVRESEPPRMVERDAA